MENYKRILVAIELIPENDAELIKTALQMTKEFGATLTVVHAIEYMSSYGAAYGISVSAEIETKLMEEANDQMKKLGGKLNIPEKNLIVKFGPAKLVILDTANKIKSDLIIVGSHGRHGIGVLLGSTANAILHGAKCDVLSIRIKKH